MNARKPHRLLAVLARIIALGVAVAGFGLVTSSVAGADPSASTWAKLRQCESSGNYRVVSDSGTYRGAYQFDTSTWQSVGGTGSPERASKSEQDFRALYLYRMRGLQPWECAGILGLRNDSDARTGRAPSPGSPSQAPSGKPKWDGHVYAQGDCSPSLKTFQLRMNQIGSKYKFQGTGCYQQMTKQAVVALQKANHIKASGRLGPKTWHAAWNGKRI
jgi:hypothetical protein